MKQLQTDPWDGVDAKYPVGAKFTGRVTNITDYGAFVELEAGVEGLVHVSEMSWTKKNVHPGKIVSSSQEVDVVVLDVDAEKRRISLGLKQAMNNPWEAVHRRTPDRLERRRRSQEHHRVRSVRRPRHRISTAWSTSSDIDWNVAGEEAMARRYNKGDIVKAQACWTWTSRRNASRWASSSWSAIRCRSDRPTARTQIVTATVTEVTTGGIEVRFGRRRRADDRLHPQGRTCRAIVRNSAPSASPSATSVDASITSVRQGGPPGLAVDQGDGNGQDEKEAIEQFGSSDSGASLGDILGAALRERATKD